MKNSVIKDIVIVGAFAGLAFYVSRYYRQKKQKRGSYARRSTSSCFNERQPLPIVNNLNACNQCSSSNMR